MIINNLFSDNLTRRSFLVPCVESHIESSHGALTLKGDSEVRAAGSFFGTTGHISVGQKVTCQTGRAI